MSLVNMREQISSQDRSVVEANEHLLAVEANLKKNPADAGLWLEKGRTLADELGLFRESIEAFSRGLSADPFHGMLYRWRAHRHLSCWEISEACADFAVAASLLPYDWDICYHYALSWFLRGEFQRAESVYRRCLDLSYNIECKVACSEWLYTTLMRLGKTAQAQKVLDGIAPDYPDADCGDSLCYYRRLQLHKGLIEPDHLLDIPVMQDIRMNTITVGYGLANYYRFRGEMDKANKMLDEILEAGSDKWWNSFAYIAAMVDRKGLKS